MTAGLSDMYTSRDITDEPKASLGYLCIIPLRTWDLLHLEWQWNYDTSDVLVTDLEENHNLSLKTLCHIEEGSSSVRSTWDLTEELQMTNTDQEHNFIFVSTNSGDSRWFC